MKLNIKRDSYKPPIVKMPQTVRITTRNDLINLNDWPKICWNLAGFTDDIGMSDLMYHYRNVPGRNVPYGM